MSRIQCQIPNDQLGFMCVVFMLCCCVHIEEYEMVWEKTFNKLKYYNFLASSNLLLFSPLDTLYQFTLITPNTSFFGLSAVFLFSFPALTLPLAACRKGKRIMNELKFDSVRNHFDWRH